MGSVCFRFSDGYYELDLTATTSFKFIEHVCYPNVQNVVTYKFNLVKMPSSCFAIALLKLVNEAGFGNELPKKMSTKLKSCCECVPSREIK